LHRFVHLVLETFACVHCIQVLRSEIGDDSKNGSRFNVFHKHNRNIRLRIRCNDAGNFFKANCVNMRFVLNFRQKGNTLPRQQAQFGSFKKHFQQGLLAYLW